MGVERAYSIYVGDDANVANVVETGVVTSLKSGRAMNPPGAQTSLRRQIGL